jgi:TRAP-type mannitol/chloroaromatic compound transport system permease large subunit
MANLLAVSVGNLFIGAIFPGLVLSGLYFFYIVTICTIKPHLAPKLPADAIHLDPTQKKNVVLVIAVLVAIVVVAYVGQESHLADEINWTLTGFLVAFVACLTIGRKEGDTLLGGILKGFVPPIFLIVMVLGSIFAGWATPTEAAGVGAFGSLVLAWFNRTLTFDVLQGVVHRTALTTAMIFFIFVGATAFSTLFRNVYGEDLIIEFIEWLDLHPWSLLITLMIAVFLLGFFFDFLEITLIILPVFAPVIRSMAPAFASHLGMDLPANMAETQYLEAQVIYWFAILAATNLQTSFLTPPFGFALFYMKGVAPSAVKMQDIYLGIIPFVILQVIGLGAVLMWPDLALWLPEQVFGH